MRKNMMRRAGVWMAASATVLTGWVGAWGGEPTSGKPAVAVDPALPGYVPSKGVSGSIKSIGSDTMNNVMAHWAELFKGFYPATSVEAEGKGSSTAPPALTGGQSQLAPMSRDFTPKEVDLFKERWGYEPTKLRVAIDCIAVFVHKDNPVERLTLEQVRQAYSVAGPNMTWGDLGVTAEGWKDVPVSLYGRLSNSGTYSFFRDHALGGTGFKETIKEQPGSSSVVQSVAADRFGMGYSAIGYKTAGVRAVPLVVEAGGSAVEPTLEAAVAGEYPLARFLTVYVNYDARTGLDPLRSAFIRMIFSREGQESVVKDGYFPVPADVAREDLTAVGLSPGF